MKKVWRNPREVTVHQVQEETGDGKRLERLVTLLATGMERLISSNNQKTPESLDFSLNVLPNTCTGKETTKMENA
jgi:hypothetical protein